MKKNRKILITISIVGFIVILGMEFLCSLGIKCKNCGRTSKSKSESNQSDLNWTLFYNNSAERQIYWSRSHLIIPPAGSGGGGGATGGFNLSSAISNFFLRSSSENMTSCDKNDWTNHQHKFFRRSTAFSMQSHFLFLFYSILSFCRNYKSQKSTLHKPWLQN